jgi:hypothetical protein
MEPRSCEKEHAENAQGDVREQPGFQAQRSSDLDQDDAEGGSRGQQNEPDPIEIGLDSKQRKEKDEKEKCKKQAHSDMKQIHNPVCKSSRRISVQIDSSHSEEDQGS